jgi:hypothetical protein
MKFGLRHLLSCSESQSRAQRYKEALDFESVWPVEQHFNQRAVPGAFFGRDFGSHPRPAPRYGNRAATPRASNANC